jgi:hypothetical protein
VRLIVCDEISKFGTLAFVKNPIPVNFGEKIPLQVGRTCLIFGIEDRLTWWQRMCCKTKYLLNDGVNSIVHYDESKKYFPKEFFHLFYPEHDFDT